MSKFDKMVQSTAESLYGDERLRGNLNDAEAKIVLDWATRWIEEQTNPARDEVMAKQISQKELARVRQTLSAINACAKNPGEFRLADAVAALDTVLKAGKPLTRQETLHALVALTGAVWKMREGK